MFKQTARGVTALAFKNLELLYVHCVSKEKLGVSVKGFPYGTLVCRKINVSFVESMSVNDALSHP